MKVLRNKDMCSQTLLVKSTYILCTFYVERGRREGVRSRKIIRVKT